ncbi:hypothetical protein KL86DES1_21497 [uncultured Desulfovibrio sp.]|uniref:Uncharacterized protein n=1 Tax=uncultured Desulfovibrio sp. TaxID=167968 RepID=A0A212L898_9BACT|nr:hypothetical protein KL86DES1_21497 [uncultured Desulfovibrio sp.]VZH34396.1 conserved protein of unknown function [Desulfovibrio sp. 86]
MRRAARSCALEPLHFFKVNMLYYKSFRGRGRGGGDPFLEHAILKKIACSNAARGCSAPQRGVDSAANRIFG